MAGLGASGSAAVVNLPQPTQPQAPQQHGNFLTHLLPTIGGIGGGALGGAAGGALAGSAVLPGVGTAVGGLLGALLGGAAGGAGGKVLENKQEGQALGNGVAKEAITNGVLSAGPLRLLKAGGAVAKGAIGGGGSLLDALGNGGAAEAKIVAPGLLGKAQASAANRSAAGFGVDVGKTVNGKVLTPDSSSALQDFIKNGSNQYGGIRTAEPIHQAADAQAVHNEVTAALGKRLDQINRPVLPHETQGITDSVTQALQKDAGITGQTQTANKLITQAQQAPDLKALEDVRKAADKEAFTQAGNNGSTSAAAQAGHVRDAIDKFITQQDPAYKAIKGDYGLSKTVMEQASKASDQAKGVHIPFVGADGKAFAQTISGAKNKVNGILAGNGGKAGDLTGLSAVGGAKGVAGRDIAGNPGDLLAALGGANQQMQQSSAIDPNAIAGNDPSSLTGALASAGGTDPNATQQAPSPFSQENIQAAMQRDIALTGGKHLSELTSLYNTFGKTQDSLTTNQKNEVVSQNRAKGSLAAYVDMLNKAGGAEGPMKGGLDSTILGNYTNPAAHAIDKQRIDVASAIAGSLNPRGTVSPVTARIIAESLPSIHDTAGVQRTKIQSLLNQIRSGAYSGETPVSQIVATNQAGN